MQTRPRASVFIRQVDSQEPAAQAVRLNSQSPYFPAEGLYSLLRDSFGPVP